MADEKLTLNVEPPVGKFEANGGNATHSILNLTDDRLAFKVKCSNNECFRVRPVYGFVDPQSKAPLEIRRDKGPAKEDKFVIQWAAVPVEETDPKAPFVAGAQAGEVVLPVRAE
ncbi:unnamed protein product [Auanema sp. JU1783]|nr:unnamed protein product [Auanema sp. JU1783]